MWRRSPSRRQGQSQALFGQDQFFFSSYCFSDKLTLLYHLGHVINQLGRSGKIPEQRTRHIYYKPSELPEKLPSAISRYLVKTLVTSATNVFVVSWRRPKPHPGTNISKQRHRVLFTAVRWSCLCELCWWQLAVVGKHYYLWPIFQNACCEIRKDQIRFPFLISIQDLHSNRPSLNDWILTTEAWATASWSLFVIILPPSWAQCLCSIYGNVTHGQG